MGQAYSAMHTKLWGLLINTPSPCPIGLRMARSDDCPTMSSRARHGLESEFPTKLPVYGLSAAVDLTYFATLRATNCPSMTSHSEDDMRVGRLATGCLMHRHQSEATLTHLLNLMVAVIISWASA